MEPADDIFRELVEHQQDLIVKISPEGRILYANPAYCELVGKSAEQLLGSIFMPVTERQYADVIATQMVKLFRPPHSCYVEQWMPTRKGTRCINWSARSLLEGTGSVRAIVASGRDITAQKKREKAIQKRDRELMLLVESGSPMYYSHTPDHVMDYVSPRIRSLLGCRPRVGKRLWTDYLSQNPANAAGLERTLRAISSGRREPVYRLEFVTAQGDTIWVEVNEIPVVKDGKTVAIVGSLVDVTEKKQVEEGFAEADILIKGSRSGMNGHQESGYGTQSPLNYFRQVLKKKERESLDPRSPEIIQK
ncbi:MAG: PAS domain-containing protein [Methanoregula sp.]|nr:MAG: PAS domain-containing protein [Methanoregula sp.]